MRPPTDLDRNAHVSYHCDGKFHSKSYGRMSPLPEKQTPTGPFSGTEQIGRFAGHSPKGVGVVCEPSAFSGVVEVAPEYWGHLGGW